MSSDVLADMMSQIKNASAAGRESVELVHSKTREAILKVIEEAGFIKDVKVFKESGLVGKRLHVGLIFEEDGSSRIRDIKRMSKPGRRMYSNSGDIKIVDKKHGVVVVSTPNGIMSGAEARKKHLGGEVICEVR